MSIVERNIAVDDLRKLRMDQLTPKQAKDLVASIEELGLSEEFVRQLDDDDLEAITEMSNNARSRVGATTAPMPTEVNWVKLGIALVSVLVVMVLLLDVVTPEAVRKDKEHKELNPKEKKNLLDFYPDKEESQPAEESAEPELKTEDVDVKTVDVEEKNTDPAVDPKALFDSNPMGDTVQGDGNIGSPKPDPVKKDEPKVNTPTPKKYVSVRSAKVILEKAANQNKKYTPNDVPKFPGGKSGLEKYVRTEIGKIKSDRTEFGTRSVMVQFDVSSKGKVENVELMTGLSEKIDAETIRIIKSMPSWYTKGKKVRMQYQMSVKYW